jgi:DNA-directed RNA polymerase specialized sigma24 family protein
MIDYLTCAEIGRRYRAERDRQVLLLRDYGLNLEQIGLVIGCSLQHVHRIVKAAEAAEKTATGPAGDS